MCASKNDRSKKYSETRSSFDDLGLNEKAAFLVESTIQMVVKGVMEAGDAASEALKNMSADFGKEDGEDSNRSARNDESGQHAGSRDKSAGKKKSKAGTRKKKKKKAGTEKNSEPEDGESTQGL